MVLDKQEKQKEPTQEIIKVILELFNSNKLITMVVCQKYLTYIKIIYSHLLQV